MPDPRTPPRSVHVVGADDPLRDAVVRAVAPREVVVHEDVQSLLGRVREGTGLEDDGGDGLADRDPARGARPSLALLVAASVSATDALLLLRTLASERSPWIVGLVEEGEEDAVVRTLSLGWARPLADLASYASGEGEAPLELRDVVRRVARARHDINSPLTSALAQTQLLLLDHGDGELGEELRLVEAQIKRIAGLVAGTASIRPRNG